MEFKNIHIGSLIKDEVKKQKMSYASFAKEIGIKRQNADSKIFNNESLDANLLKAVSKVLNFNFFQYYEPIGIVANECNKENYISNNIIEVKAQLMYKIGGETKEETLFITLERKDVTN